MIIGRPGDRQIRIETGKILPWHAIHLLSDYHTAPLAFEKFCGISLRTVAAHRLRRQS